MASTPVFLFDDPVPEVPSIADRPTLSEYRANARPGTLKEKAPGICQGLLLKQQLAA
jgi:hypothetical protein